MRLFVFGYGYVARRLGARLAAEGWSVAGTTRSGADPTAGDGVALHAHGPDKPLDAANADLQAATHILMSAPPGESGDPVLPLLADAIGTAGDLAWVGYLSTTGVYGDHNGGEVDETTPTNPTGERGGRRVKAEDTWQALAPPAHVFRLPGIYGPGRSAIDQIRSGRARPILKPGHKFSRAHVDDIVETVVASMRRPRAGAVYNVTDDLPAESAEVIAYAAKLMGVPAPQPIPFEEAELSPMAASFYRDNKTVANGLIKRELGVHLRYPTYKEGLAAILADYSAG